jgi:D-erythrose 4-phosphate dehydrogenase
VLRAAINGYGRIGRCVLRALHESPHRERLQVVAINEPADLDSMVHLTRYDSIHGRFVRPVGVGSEHPPAMLVGDDRIAVSHAVRAADLDWHGLGLDLVFECSGVVETREQAAAYLAAGAPRLLVSNPMAAAGEVDATVVYGVNHGLLGPGLQVVSNASCTTNCAVPLLKAIDDRFGIDSAVITAVHSAMNDQPVQDGYHSRDLRRTRAAMHSILPVSTGLSRGVERLLPQLTGRVQAHHLRVPTLNVSAMSFCLAMRTESVSVAEVNAYLRAIAETDALHAVLGYTDRPHASCDFNHDSRSLIVDATQTTLAGGLLHLLAWFDNEWGFANRMLDVALAWGLEGGQR